MPIIILNYLDYYNPSSGGPRGLTVIVVGNGYGDTSSNPGQGCLHFT